MKNNAKLRGAFKAAAADVRKNLKEKALSVAAATSLSTGIAAIFAGAAILPAIALPVAVGSALGVFVPSAVKAGYQAYKQSV